MFCTLNLQFYLFSFWPVIPYFTPSIVRHAITHALVSEMVVPWQLACHRRLLFIRWCKSSSLIECRSFVHSFIHCKSNRLTDWITLWMQYIELDGLVVEWMSECITFVGQACRWQQHFNFIIVIMIFIWCLVVLK